MNDYQRYYVYEHHNPDTQQIVYVGLGQKERAWTMRPANRSEDHRLYLEDLLDKGYVPSDWVSIVGKALTLKEAEALEQKLIELYKPKYNKSKNPNYNYYTKFTNEIRQTFKGLREIGLSYTHIAFLCGADGKQSRKNTKAMSVWRAIND